MNQRVINAADAIARSVMEKTFKENRWGARHYRAWFAPLSGHESALVTTLKGLATYADAHQDACESPLGSDGVIGRYWLDSLVGLLRLRDGEHGRLDAGTLGEMARAMAAAAGFSQEECDEIG